MIENIVAGNGIKGYSNSQFAAARNIGNPQLATRVRMIPLEYPYLVLTLWNTNQSTYTYGTFIDTVCNPNSDTYICQNMVINDVQGVS